MGGEVVPFPNSDWGDRLERAGEYERDTGAVHKAALDQRNWLVHEAVNARYPQNLVATRLKVSASTITRILASPQPGQPPEAA